MNKLWTVVLVLVVAAAAFFLGRHYQTVPVAPAATPAATPPSAAQAATTPDSEAKPLSAEPPRTFRGPDGLPRLIAYEVGDDPDNSDPELIKAALLADMKNHPRNIERSYDLTQEQIEAIVAGKEPFPEILLPKPGAAGRK